MLLHRTVLAGLGSLALFALVGSSYLAADEETHRRKFMEPVAKYLGFTSDQKMRAEKICAEFDRKEDPILQQIMSLHHQECEALKKVLTDEQRAKLPEVVKEAWQQTLARVDRKLDLNPKQQERIKKIHEEYAPQYRKLSESPTTKPGEFRALRHQECAAISNELTEEQRAKLPFVIESEFQQWQQPEVRQERMRYFADKLGMTDEQKERVKKIGEEYAPRIKEQFNELKKIRQAEMEALSGLLNETQRNKLQELKKAAHGERE